MLYGAGGGGGGPLRSEDRGREYQRGWRSGQAGKWGRGREVRGAGAEGPEEEGGKRQGTVPGSGNAGSWHGACCHNSGGHPELWKHGKRGQEEQKPCGPSTPSAPSGSPAGLAVCPRVCGATSQPVAACGGPLLSLEAPPSPSWEVRARSSCSVKLGPVGLLLPCVPVGKVSTRRP